MTFPRFGILFSAAFALLFIALAGSRAALANEGFFPPEPPLSTSTLDMQDRQIVDMLTILSDNDVRLYRDIFRLQEDGKWKEANQRIAKLSDRLLMGHVLYERYMHPRAYRSTYIELKDWMRDYADHPDAERIYKLAAKRRPANYKWPQKPGWPAVKVSLQDPTPLVSADDGGESRLKARRRTNRHTRYVENRIRHWLRLNAPTKAYSYFSQRKVYGHFDTIGHDEVLARIASGFYRVDKDEKALELAGKAARRSGEYVPDAHWWAGLAAWRLGQRSLAAEHFEALARSRYGSEWLASAGAYWAARAYLSTRQPEKVIPMLELAAAHPLTFYGVLGQEALAIKNSIDWTLPRADTEAAREIVNIRAARRGLALLQVGQDQRGIAELKRIFGRLPQRHLQTLMTYADRAQVASLSYQLGNSIRWRDGRWHGAALYPLPSWEPKNGYQVDRALIFALMRQESTFKTNAKSRAGARGLMQLMPGTASFISGDRYRGWRRDKLYDPELNVTLGQKYMVHLLETPEIDGNLFKAVAAYNGGPGNLRRWMRGLEFQNDPLLFIESIPARETRDYVEKVLTNLWLYRDRLGQPRPSLRDVVAGDWPVYSALDPLNKQVAFQDQASEGSFQSEN